MDDLSGLEWSTSSNSNNNSKAPVVAPGKYYPSLRPTPSPQLSGTSTPLSTQGSGPSRFGAPQNKTSTQDSFANLVSFGSSKPNTLTLQEQQLKLQAEKAKKEAEQRREYDAQFGSSHFLDNLTATSQAVRQVPPISSQNPTLFTNQSSGGLRTLPPTSIEEALSNEDDDLFKAFNADTKVDRSSHYPPHSIPSSGKNTPVQNERLDLSKASAWETRSSLVTFDDSGIDDDPFGLLEIGQKKSQAVPDPTPADDDDFLGDLGKPVEEVKRHIKKLPEVAVAIEDGLHEQTNSDDPWDKAVAELVEMGFSAENSRRALTESGAGLDVQAAVGWLLADAHRQAKQKSQTRATSAPRSESSHSRTSNGPSKETTSESRTDAIPAWMRQEGRDRSQPRRDDSRSPAGSDGDVSRTAAAVGSTLLKSANSLWKTSQKKVQRVVADFQQESDSSQPKWMRPAGTGPHESIEPEQRSDSTINKQRGRSTNSSPAIPDVTDEALMLEMDSRPQPRRQKLPPDPRTFKNEAETSRGHSPATASNTSTGSSTPSPRWQPTTSSFTANPKPRLSKQAVEEQTGQAYVSPARRKIRAQPATGAGGTQGSNGNTIGGTTQTQAQANLSIPKPQPPRSSTPSTPIVVRPKKVTRSIPNLSPSALAASSTHRLAGTAHFKRGDYASAHESYSAAISPLPQTHPIIIILLCNRALTGLKIGEPKLAVTDADTALEVIGVSRGEGEIIDLHDNGAGEGKKDMKEFWGKALMRKAEALEQMERWADARDVWKEAAESGVGGGTAIQGRQRCEKALQPKPKPSAALKVVPPKPKASALADLGPPVAQKSEAVNRMRAANAAAEKADDEKFALGDRVDAQISKWRDGRKDNLRALLGGMDQVLWEGSGWNKVGMHELVINGKVKINYMKAIAKVHPDKLPQNATTEMQMISAAVFATLNEAWDKFKSDNGM